MLNGRGHGGRLGNNRQLHDEPCAYGLVLFYTNGAVMVFYHAAHDREA
jgi:hypothetical protein